MTTETMKIQMLPPEALLANRNARFGLKKFRVQAMADSIKALGRVETPLKIEPLEEEGPNGEKYLVREGHYRHAGALLVNKDGGGIKVPCEIVEPLEGAERVKHQVRENLDRENLSPMDIAVAAKELLDAGESKLAVRELFARPGGRKGLAMQPLSNSMLNIYVSFLDFPKAIQNKIHDGTLGVADAYKLTTKPREAWEEILTAAEEDRLKVIDIDEKLEERFLSEQRKLEEAEAKAKAEAEAREKAEAAAEELQKSSKAKLDEAAEAYKAMASIPVKDKDAKKKAEEAFRAKEAAAKVEERKANDAVKEADKLKQRADAQAKLAAERKEKLESARKAAEVDTRKKGGKLDIEKAAQKVTGQGNVALSRGEIMKVCDTLCMPGSFPKVTEIGKALKRCFTGLHTENMLVAELSFITGERKDRPKTMGVAPKAAAPKAAKAS